MDNQDIEVVVNDDNDLEISPVYEHLNAAKPKTTKEKPTCIVIPKGANKNSKNKENDKDDDKEEYRKKEEI